MESMEIDESITKKSSSDCSDKKTVDEAETVSQETAILSVETDGIELDKMEVDEVAAKDFTETQENSEAPIDNPSESNKNTDKLEKDTSESVEEITKADEVADEAVKATSKTVEDMDKTDEDVNKLDEHTVESDKDNDTDKLVEKDIIKPVKNATSDKDVVKLNEVAVESSIDTNKSDENTAKLGAKDATNIDDEDRAKLIETTSDNGTVNVAEETIKLGADTNKLDETKISNADSNRDSAVSKEGPIASNQDVASNQPRCEDITTKNADVENTSTIVETNPIVRGKTMELENAENEDTMEIDDVLMKEELSPLPADAVDNVPEGAMEDLLLRDDPSSMPADPVAENKTETPVLEAAVQVPANIFYELTDTDIATKADANSASEEIKIDPDNKESSRNDDSALEKESLSPNSGTTIELLPISDYDNTPIAIIETKSMETNSATVSTTTESDPDKMLDESTADCDKKGTEIDLMDVTESVEATDPGKDAVIASVAVTGLIPENSSENDQAVDSTIRQKESEADVALEAKETDSNSEKLDPANKSKDNSSEGVKLIMMSPDRNSETTDACVDDELGLLAEATTKEFDEEEEEHEGSSDGNLDDEEEDDEEAEADDNDEDEGDAEDEAGDSTEHDDFPETDEGSQFAPTISAVSGNIDGEDELQTDESKDEKGALTEKLGGDDKPKEDQPVAAASDSERQDSNSAIRIEILPMDKEDANLTARPPPDSDKPAEEEMTIDEDLDFKTIAADLKVDLADIAVADSSFDGNIFDAIMQTIADEEVDVKVKIRTPEPQVCEDETPDKVGDDKTASGDKMPETPGGEKSDRSDSEKDVSDTGSDFQLRMESDEEKEPDPDTEEGLLAKRQREEQETLQRKKKANALIKLLKRMEQKKERENEERLKATHDEIDKQLSELDRFISEKLKKSFVDSVKIKTEPVEGAAPPAEPDVTSETREAATLEKSGATTAPVVSESAENEPTVAPIESAGDSAPLTDKISDDVSNEKSDETTDVEMVESAPKSTEIDDVPDRSPEPMDTVAESVAVPSPKKPEEKTVEAVPEKPKRNRLRLDDREPTEILDLESDEEGGGYKKTEKCYICVNASCTTPSSGKWLDSPIFVLSYFKVKRRRKEQQKVCESCFEEVVQHYERLAYCVTNGTPICAMEHKVKHTEFVEISDSESESEEEGDFTSVGGIRMEDQDFITANLINKLNDTWDKYDMQKQVDLFTEDLKVNLVKVEKDTEDLNTLFSKLQNTMDTIAMNLYQSFKPDVLENAAMILDSVYPGEENTDIQTCLVEEQLKQSGRNEENQNNTKDAVTGDDAEVSVVRQDIEHAPQDLPPPGELKLRIPKLGDVVFAVKKSAFGAWGRAEVLEVWPKGSMLPSGAVSAFTICRVRFESKNKPSQLMKSLTGRQISIAEPVPVRLDVGTRVIAMFKDQDNLYKEDIYYSGVIAEPPKPVNGFRYLVFFDDGYAQYAEHSRLLVVCEHSPRVWEDVHPDSRDFVRKYLQAYPERPMVRLQRGQQLKTEWNGAWWWCTVVDVDASLARISFPEGRQEWVYRGSTRLAPLYRELATMPGQTPVQGPIVSEMRKDAQQMAPPVTQAPPTPARSHATARRSMAARSGMNMPYVEYTNADKDAEPEDSEANKVRRHADAGGVTVDPPKRQAVAKKSTAAQQPQPAAPQPKKNETSDQFTSRVVYYAPKSYIKPHKMVPHKCSFKCQRTDVLPLRAIKNYNPLAKPILAGWERLFERFRGRKAVMYRSPCGRRLRTIQELHQYLRATESEMSIDLFCFDCNVHCLGEFVLNKCFAIKKDITQGRENIPIPCVNYYDDKMPEFCVYSTTRTPTRGVNLNLSDEFLSGCDCTDDCLDKSKCQCWQLTYNGARFMGVKALDRVGYQYKRLPDSVQTGIYECNSRCKCAKTCLNRVVQHPLQLKLQVFKTFNRGWGIRALNDLPKGTFICVYAGNLLTDATANEDGLIEGDEYLAELDYIEVVENLKLDYEADVPLEDKILDRRNIAKKPSSGRVRSSKSGTASEADDESDKSDAEENSEKRSYEQDQDFRPEYSVRASEKLISTRLRTRQDKDRGSSKDSEKDKGSDNQEPEDDTITISDDEEIREPSRFAAPEGLGDERVSKYKSVRSFFGGEDEACFIMDAKVQGNIGRYLNHSCSPNVFVQNVFVDTHDPRFPWVAFFALTYIRAGTELTWDYNYDVGSVHGKVILCKCGAANCRGRLL